MTVQTYQELFYHATFPVFVICRNTGDVIFKNLFCEKYISWLSRKNLLNSFIFSQNSVGAGPVDLLENGFYHMAVALEDEENLVFLLLERLQYENDICYASHLFQQFGPTLTDFLHALHLQDSTKTRGSVLSGIPTKLYTETAKALFDESPLDFHRREYFYPVISEVFARWNTAFSGLGYRVNAQIEEDVPPYLCADVSINDILFIYNRLLYLQMKLSKDKAVDISLSCDMAYSQYVLRMTAKTDLARLSDSPDELMDWLLDFIPECWLDFSLLYQTNLLTDDNFMARVDRFGNLTVLFRIPYQSPEARYVRSFDMLDPLFLNAIDFMLENLLASFTDSGASC